MSMHIALPVKVQGQLETALVLYRKAITDIDAAIKSEAWETIHRLQGRRDLQAHTIATIINNCALDFVGKGVPA